MTTVNNNPSMDQLYQQAINIETKIFKTGADSLRKIVPFTQTTRPTYTRRRTRRTRSRSGEGRSRRETLASRSRSRSRSKSRESRSRRKRSRSRHRRHRSRSFSRSRPRDDAIALLRQQMKEMKEDWEKREKELQSESKE